MTTHLITDSQIDLIANCNKLIAFTGGTAEQIANAWVTIDETLRQVLATTNPIPVLGDVQEVIRYWLGAGISTTDIDTAFSNATQTRPRLAGNWWAVQASVSATGGDGFGAWTTTRQLPTFYIDANVQGLLNQASVEDCARRIIDAWPERGEGFVSVSVVRL